MGGYGERETNRRHTKREKEERERDTHTQTYTCLYMEGYGTAMTTGCVQLLFTAHLLTRVRVSIPSLFGGGLALARRLPPPVRIAPFGCGAQPPF